MHFHF